MSIDYARPGFYVRGRWYSPAHRAQAYARAEFLAREHLTRVTVLQVELPNSSPTTAHVAWPPD